MALEICHLADQTALRTQQTWAEGGRSQLSPSCLNELQVQYINVLIRKSCVPTLFLKAFSHCWPDLFNPGFPEGKADPSGLLYLKWDERKQWTYFYTGVSQVSQAALFFFVFISYFLGKGGKKKEEREKTSRYEGSNHWRWETAKGNKEVTHLS